MGGSYFQQTVSAAKSTEKCPGCHPRRHSGNFRIVIKAISALRLAVDDVFVATAGKARSGAAAYREKR